MAVRGTHAIACITSCIFVLALAGYVRAQTNPAANTTSPAQSSAMPSALKELPVTPAPATSPAAQPPAAAVPTQPAPHNYTAPINPNMPHLNTPAPLNATAAPASVPFGTAVAPLSSSQAVPPAAATPNPPAPAPASVTSPASAPAPASSALPVLELKGDNKSNGPYVPVHWGDESLMFSKNDMQILKPFIEAYNRIYKMGSNAASDSNDDLRSLWQSLHLGDDANAQTKQMQPLVNLYLESIVYYSPSQWSVWINGKKLLATRNQPGEEYYVSELSRKEIVLVWKPKNFSAIGVAWQQMTQNGKKPLPDMRVDNSKGTITLHMHTNQTFVPKTLTLREGYVRTPPPPPAVSPANSGSDSASLPIPGASTSIGSMPTGSALPSIPTITGEIHR